MMKETGGEKEDVTGSTAEGYASCDTIDDVIPLRIRARSCP